MKLTLFGTLALLAFTFISPAVQAQTASDAAAISAFWEEIWTAYQSGDTEKMWSSYTEDAAEISPDGHLTSGKKNLRESWDAFMKMVDQKPEFTFANPSVRMLTAEFAILTWNSEADIKIGGQQVGGKALGMALVRKIKGRWMIEFDSLTPVMEMPEPPSADKQH